MHLRDIIAPGSKLLARRLDQLCSTLECLSGRLKTTLVSVVGDSIGGLVRDAAMGVLDNVNKCLADPSQNPSVAQARPFAAYPEDDDSDYWYDDVTQARENPAPQPWSTPTQPGRLPAALSAGLQVASFWLRRWSGRSRLLITCVAGLAATGFAFLGGPLAMALLDLAASASQFNFLPGAIDGGVSAIGLYDSD